MTPQEVVELALSTTSSDRAVVVVRDSSSANLRWAGNTLTTNGDSRARDVTVISIVDSPAGAAVGVVTRGVADRLDLVGLVEAADAAAADASPAPDARDLVTPVVSDDWDEPSLVTSSSVFAGFAPQLAAAFDEARGREAELFGFAEHSVTTTYLGGSNGMRLRHVQPDGLVELTGKAEHRTRSTWVGRHVPDFGVVDVSGQAAEVWRQLRWQQRQVTSTPGRHDVVLAPSAVADLLVYQYWVSAARDAFEGRTVFSRPGGGTRVGEQVSSVPVTLWSDPFDGAGPCEPFVVAEATTGATSVFDNGLPLGRTEWITDGVLRALVQSRYSAELTDLPVTPFIDNLSLSVSAGAGSLDDLVAGVDRGLLVNTLWYIREVDPQILLLTGLTRDGVYVIEGGEVVGATNNFRFNESPTGLLSRISAATATESTLPREWNDEFTRIAMPGLRVPDFNMSTVSQAS